jgi:hypothetical protein
MRLLARTEPVIAGLTIGADGRPVECAFATGVTEVHLGSGTPGMYPLEHAGCEFLRARCNCLRRAVAALDLPLCNVVPIFTTSVRAAHLFQPESVDFCFIDADHSYVSVLADLRGWWPKIKPGGSLAGRALNWSCCKAFARVMPRSPPRKCRRGIGDQNASALKISWPLRVPSPHQVVRSTESFMNFTEPSQKATLTPPG